MLLDSVEDIHAVLAVNHVYSQTPLAKAARAPDAVQVGLVVRVPVLVHRKVKIDDDRHLFNINTCTTGLEGGSGKRGHRQPHTPTSTGDMARAGHVWAVGTKEDAYRTVASAEEQKASVWRPEFLHTKSGLLAFSQWFLLPEGNWSKALPPP